jgi:hypothetical protein
MLPGLTLKERLWKLHLVSMLYASLLGDDIASPHGDFAKSTLGGFGSCTLKAFATNAAAITQALVCRTPSQKKVLPNALHILLRAWVETDDLENGFSRLKANLGGWKGDAEAMRVAGPRGEAHATIRRNADRGFSLGKDSKSKSVQSALLSRLATKDNRPCGSLNRPVVTLAPLVACVVSYEFEEFHRAQLARWWSGGVVWERQVRWEKFRQAIAQALPKQSIRKFHRKT